MVIDYVVVGLGGALGAMARVALGKLLPIAIMGLPTQVLLVNVLGCFLMGCLTALLTAHGFISAHMRGFLAAGFLGGFTTFSSFAFDFGALCEKHLYVSAVFYALLSVILSLSLFFAGIKFIRLFLP